MTSLPVIPADIASIPERWAAAWSQPDATKWVALYDSAAVYTDHAFQIVRSGPATLTKHHKIWLSAHPDFVMTVDLSRPVLWREDVAPHDNGKTVEVIRANFRTINKGTFEGRDLPNGRKPSGKKFVFVGIVDIIVERETGLIVQLDEWYTNNAFDTKGDSGLEEYNIVKDWPAEKV